MTQFTKMIISVTQLIESIKTCSPLQLAVVSLVLVLLAVVVLLPVAMLAF